jgi:hypothetical protein
MHRCPLSSPACLSEDGLLFRGSFVAGLIRQFHHRPVLPILPSCPLCASWFNPPLLFNHEGHQRHETHSHAETPSPPRLEYPSSRISMTAYLRPDTDTVGLQTPLSHTADEETFPSAVSASLRETTPKLLLILASWREDLWNSDFSHAEARRSPSKTNCCPLSSPACLSGDCLLLRISVVAATAMRLVPALSTGETNSNNQLPLCGLGVSA